MSASSFIKSVNPGAVYSQAVDFYNSGSQYGYIPSALKFPSQVINVSVPVFYVAPVQLAPFVPGGAQTELEYNSEITANINSAILTIFTNAIALIKLYYNNLTKIQVMGINPQEFIVNRGSAASLVVAFQDMDLVLNKFQILNPKSVLNAYES